MCLQCVGAFHVPAVCSCACEEWKCASSYCRYVQHVCHCKPNIYLSMNPSITWAVVSANPDKDCLWIAFGLFAAHPWVRWMDIPWFPINRSPQAGHATKRFLLLASGSLTSSGLASGWERRICCPRKPLLTKFWGTHRKSHGYDVPSFNIHVGWIFTTIWPV